MILTHMVMFKFFAGASESDTAGGLPQTRIVISIGIRI